MSGSFSEATNIITSYPQGNTVGDKGNKRTGLFCTYMNVLTLFLHGKGTPGSRRLSAGWYSASDNTLWMFGGQGTAATTTSKRHPSYALSPPFHVFNIVLPLSFFVNLQIVI